MFANLRRRAVTQAVIVGSLYFAAATATIVSTRFNGGLALLWIATPVLIAALMNAPRRRWPWLVGGAWVGAVLAGAIFGFGPAAAPFIASVNIAEAVLATTVLARLDARQGAFDSIDRLAAFVLAAGILAPAVTAFPAAIIAEVVTGTGLIENAVTWFTGHALGTLTFAPVFSLVAAGEVRRWFREATPASRVEGALLMTLTTATAAAVFWQTSMPLLFVPMLPIILTTFRMGSIGAAGSVVLVAITGGVLSILGHGPVVLMGGSLAEHALFFQFYLAATVLTALPVAADLARRGELYRRLHDSEARYRLLTDHSTDIVMNLDAEGVIRYVSPSIAQLGGYQVEEVVGSHAAGLIHADDLDVVRKTHLDAVKSPGETFIVEFRGRTRDGQLRWFETHARGLVDGGVVSVTRDVSHRKSIEARLSHAALTDPLTELPNRRLFDAEFEARVAAAASGGASGCIAVFDLDHFKGVNDSHGHEIGDAVLRSFARIARDSLRDGDLVARLGGEEFGVLLGGAGVAQAEAVCERLRESFARSELLLADGRSLRVTVSAGVAAFDGTLGPADVLRAADAALYEAKALGRDRLRLAA